MPEREPLTPEQRALDDLRWYSKRLCVDNPRRYEVWQTRDGAESRLSESVEAVLDLLDRERARAEAAEKALTEARSEAASHLDGLKVLAGVRDLRDVEILLLKNELAESQNEWEAAATLIGVRAGLDAAAKACMREAELWDRNDLAWPEGVSDSPEGAIGVVEKAIRALDAEAIAAGVKP